MTSTRTRAGAAQSGRNILLAVNASAESEDALQWTLANMYRSGDVLHFLHVIPRQEPATTYGAPPVDFLPQQNPKSVQRLAEQGLSFIKERLLPMLGDIQPDPVVHIVKSDTDTDSIGNVVCQRAEALAAVAVVMAGHSKSRVGDFFMGSVTNFCTHHCKKPVLVVH
ncbi:TPA: hypothetical protein ACH3X2_011817 [Trebouxia sp. C0005]|nr:MAG: hypothetical protein FRX49_02163 [Trebouxia sp. A1-2]